MEVLPCELHAGVCSAGLSLVRAQGFDDRVAANRIMYQDRITIKHKSPCRDILLPDMPKPHWLPISSHAPGCLKSVRCFRLDTLSLAT